MKVCLIYRKEDKEKEAGAILECRTYWEANGFWVEERSVSKENEAAVVMEFDGTSVEYCVFWGDIGFHCPISNGSFALNRIRNCVNIVFLSKESYLKDMEDQDFSLSTYLLMDESFVDKYKGNDHMPNVLVKGILSEDLDRIREDSVEYLRIGEAEKRDGDRLIRELLEYKTNKVGVADRKTEAELWEFLREGDSDRIAACLETFSVYYHICYADRFAVMKRATEICAFETQMNMNRMLDDCSNLDGLIVKQRKLEGICEAFAYQLSSDEQERALSELMRNRFSAVSVYYMLRFLNGCAKEAYSSLAAYYRIQGDNVGSALLLQAMESL